MGTVAHACNARYLGVRDHEDCNLRLAWTKRLWDSILIYKPDMMAVIPRIQENMGRRIMFWGQPREKTWDTTWKIFKIKRDDGVAQVVEHLPTQCEALSSNARTAKKSGPSSLQMILKIIIIIFGAGDWTQGLAHTMQALYHWAIPPALGCFVWKEFMSCHCHLVAIMTQSQKYLKVGRKAVKYKSVQNCSKNMIANMAVLWKKLISRTVSDPMGSTLSPHIY
jgi:hypothetical protein